MNKRRLEIEFRLSEIRSAMNSGKLDNADLTDAKRAELQVEHGKLETEFRVLVTAELKAASAPKVDAEDGEAAEHRALLGRVEVRQYLGAAATGTELRGAEAELNSALKLEARAGTILPWEALAPVEERADAITQAPGDTGVRQRSIVGRVFAQTAAAHLGVQMPSVGVGESMFVYLSGGTSPAQRAEGARGDATAATFATKTFKPKRLEARYVFGVEDLATLAGMESALRADLRGALGEAMDSTIIGLGGAQIRGLLATAANGGLAAFADPGAVVNATTMIATLSAPAGWTPRHDRGRDQVRRRSGDLPQAGLHRRRRQIRFHGFQAESPGFGAHPRCDERERTGTHRGHDARACHGRAGLAGRRASARSVHANGHGQSPRPGDGALGFRHRPRIRGVPAQVRLGVGPC